MPKRNKSNPTGEELLFSWQTSKLHIQKQKSCFVSPTIYVISFMFVTLKTFSCTWETKSDHVRRSKWNYTSLLYIWFTKCVTVRDSLISHPDLNFHVNETHSHPSVCRPLQTCFQFTCFILFAHTDKWALSHSTIQLTLHFIEGVLYVTATTVTLTHLFPVCPHLSCNHGNRGRQITKMAHSE